MILRQTFTEAINGYWNGGPKKQFDWTIEGQSQSDTRGQYTRVGSWTANYWFHVATGQTEKQTLGNVRRSLTQRARRAGQSCTFEYVEE